MLQTNICSTSSVGKSRDSNSSSANSKQLNLLTHFLYVFSSLLDTFIVCKLYVLLCALPLRGLWRHVGSLALSFPSSAPSSVGLFEQ